ncbi:M48 family metalloprotease [Enterovibrio sp. ZSDZ35]|uniref:M48 family metalloprotease n=1 Tax=Enterovibrio qingdaonensis TaxID=2899818 RepID=A0ABT5QJF5_9GAMM|nr:M48 family metalloprotease [Enterovibrio sp. ZSDZ35]MDD1781121.1 M48 family metalloprotease [Enterovibrio sp. ZSDZ35]
MLLKAFIPVATLLLLSGCGLATLTGSTYESFDGKFIEQETNKEKEIENTDSSKTANKQPQENDVSISGIRAASDKDLMRNPYAHKYLNKILDRVVIAWGKELPNPVYLSITTDRSYTASASNDTIMISLGVLADAESEDEIAFIIAHELSHILLKHNETNEYFAKQKALVSKAANVAMVTASLQDVNTTKTTTGLKVNFVTSEETAGQVGDIYRTGLTINRLSRDIISSSMSRSDEDESDLMAIDLIAKAGYSPSAYQDVMQRMASSQTFNEAQLAAKKQDFQSFVSMASEANKKISGLNTETLLYMAANEASTRLLQSFADRHNSPEEREIDLAHYVKREYRKERKRRLDERSLEKNLNSGSSIAITENYWFASEAFRAIEAGNIEQAEKLAKKAVRGKTKYHPYPRLAFYTVRLKQGNSSKALANLNLIKHWDYASIQTFNLAAQAYRSVGKPKRAKDVLDIGSKSLGVEMPFYPEYIRAYREQNNNKLATQSFNACKQISEDNIIEQCYEAAGVQRSPDERKNGSGVLGFLDSMTSLVEM